MTIYVESNFVLEIVLGQEQRVAAERMLVAAERSEIDLALPSFALTEPFVRISRGSRDRERLMTQFQQQVIQLARSEPHETEVQLLNAVPGFFRDISLRESERLVQTVNRILPTARLIDLSPAAFLIAQEFQTRFYLDIEDAVILDVIANDASSHRGMRRHQFANANRKHFDNPGLMEELRRRDCDLVWNFADIVRHLETS